MKLALAIVVCSGVYLCAVSATRGKRDDPKLRKTLIVEEDRENFFRDHKIWEHFFGDYEEFISFPTNYEEYEVLSKSEDIINTYLEYEKPLNEFLKAEAIIQRYLKNNVREGTQFEKEKDPNYMAFLKQYPGYVNYVAFKNYCGDGGPYKKFLTEYRGYKLFIEGYGAFLQFLEFKDPRYARFPKREDGYKLFFDHLQICTMFTRKPTEYGNFLQIFQICTKFTKNEQGFENFVEIVSKRYEQFVTNSELGLSPEHRGVHPLPKYNLKEESFHYLYEADLDFKLKCIEAYQARFAFNPKELGWDLKNGKMYVAAYSALEEQIGKFIEDLKKTGIDEESKVELNRLAQINNNFLNFFGFWFAPTCGPSALRKEIEAKKKLYPSYNDKAAKVMVLFERFAGDKENVQYPKV